MAVKHEISVRQAAALVALAIAHMGLAGVSPFVITSPFEVSLLWLPAGLGVAACMHFGWRASIAVFAGALWNNLGYDTAAGVALAIACANAAQCMVVAWLLRYFLGIGIPGRDATVGAGQWARNPMYFFAVVALGAMTAPTLGTLVLAVSGIIARDSFATYWAGWWVGDLLGIALVAPLTFQLWSQLNRLPRPGSWKAAFALAMMPAGLVVVAINWRSGIPQQSEWFATSAGDGFQYVASLLSGAGLVTIALLLLRAERQVVLASERLGQSMMRQGMAIGADRMATWTWNLATGKISYSPEFFAQLGHEDNAFPGDYANWATRIHPDDLPGALAYLNEHLVEKKMDYQGMQFRMRTQSGNWVWLQSSGTIVRRDGRGNPRLLVGVTTEVAARKPGQARRQGKSVLPQWHEARGVRSGRGAGRGRHR